MKNKFICIIFCIFLLFATTVSANLINIKKIDERNNTPIPGDMENNIFPEKKITLSKHANQQKILLKTQRDDNIANIIQNINEDMYLNYLEDLVDFGPRVTATVNCEEASEYIYNTFVDMGLETRYHYWEDYDYYGNNIEATIHGIDESSDEVYIICAHYDSVPESPGADDDGSGTAAVMLAAQVLSDYEFNHTIKFVTFSGEEQGLFGSYYYVTEAVENNINIAGVLNLDMISYAETANDKDRIRVYEGDFSQDLLDITTEVSQDYSDIFSIDVIPSGYSWGSDHYYFWQAGFNALFYIEENFNPNYHTPEDTIDNIDASYAVENTQLTIATLATLAELTIINAPETPNEPRGENRGKIDVEYTYETETIDPQENQVYYWFDWGDGTNSGWLGPYPSGGTIEAKHTWPRQGNYVIRVKAKDIDNHESKWSDSLTVVMPRNRQVNNLVTLKLVKIILNLFNVKL